MKKYTITHDDYLKAAQMDKKSARAYFAKSINKTEQQKALESLLAESIDSGILEKTKPYRIADLACGGGTLSYHLASFFPNATFCLMDYNDDALELAKEITSPFKDRVEFVQGDLRSMPFADSSFDLVFCWGVFLIFDETFLSGVLDEVRRVLKPQGKLYASSLFNTEFDVDLKCDFRDLTRDSGKAGIWGRYTTYSLPTMTNLLQHYSAFTIHPFNPTIDFPRTTHRGIATYSVRIQEDREKIVVDKDFGGAFVGAESTKDSMGGGAI